MIQKTLDKKQQVSFWIQKLRSSTSKVCVGNYCYRCLITGCEKTKTVIVFPDEVEKKGIIAIDKPLEEVELIDIIGLYKKIK